MASFLPRNPDGTLDRQAVFTTAVTGLLAQGGPAYTTNGCRYRAPNGNKCAIGHLIPDDMYRSRLEGSRASTVLTVDLFEFLTPDDVHFVDDLQSSVHDNPARSRDWSRFPLIARAFARSHDLEVPDVLAG